MKYINTYINTFRTYPHTETILFAGNPGRESMSTISANISSCLYDFVTCATFCYKIVIKYY